MNICPRCNKLNEVSELENIMVCAECLKSADGIQGTDNVSVLFPDRLSAAPLPPQPEVVQTLEELALLAATGKITGIIVLAFSEVGADKAIISGKVSFRDGVSSLEQMKFGILARDLQDKVRQQ